MKENFSNKPVLHCANEILAHLNGWNFPITQALFRSPPPDEQAMYLRGTRRSPEEEAATMAGRFKLRYGVGAGIDVYSQVRRINEVGFALDCICF